MVKQKKKNPQKTDTPAFLFQWIDRLNFDQVNFKQDIVHVSALQGHNQRSGLFQKLLDQAARCPPLQYDFKWRKKLKSIDFKWWF